MTLPSLKVLKHFEMLQRLIDQGDYIESFSKNIVDENSISRLNGSNMLRVKLDNDNHVYLHSIGLIYYNQNSISENHRLVEEVIQRGGKVRDILKIDGECLGCSKIEITKPNLYTVIIPQDNVITYHGTMKDGKIDFTKNNQQNQQ